jgi:hypothetical protein
MQIYIDESGDAGFKTDKGSSKCLVLCLVCFKNEELAKRAIQAINGLRLELGSATSLIENADIFIDGSGDRSFRREFSAYLRREFEPADGRHFRSFRFVKESENNQLIQLADMCAGAIGRSYSPEKKNHEFYKSHRQKNQK